MTKINEHLIESLQNALESYPLVKVLFKTKMGKERMMFCTRYLSAIPEADHDGINDFRLNHESIIAVYDFQNSGWRSFRKDSVISFEATTEAY